MVAESVSHHRVLCVMNIAHNGVDVVSRTNKIQLFLEFF